MAKRTKLKTLRIKHDLTQSEMAERMGVNRNTISGVESGKSKGSADFWYKLQTVFNIDGDELWQMIEEGVEKA